MSETNYIQYKWFIPSIIEVLDNQVDEMQVTIKSLYKLKLNFTNKADDKVNLLLNPLLSLREFKYTLRIWMNDPKDQLFAVILYDIVKIPTKTIQCKAQTKLYQLAVLSAGQMRKIVKDKVYSHHIPEVGLNIDLTFSYETEVTNPVSDSISILHDLEQLFISGEFHDAVIKTSEGKQIKVHKNILAMRCKVLKAMFQYETIETTTNVVEAPFNDVTMDNLLLYIYCYKTPDIDTIADKLFVAADYYQLDELKSKCAEKLIEQLSEENVFEILELAVLYSCKIIEEGALNFIHNLDKDKDEIYQKVLQF